MSEEKKKVYIPKPKEWFVKRIGKRIYRDKGSCECQTCERIEKEGLIVRDKSHADYLTAIDSDFGAEGQFCNYRDNL